MAKFSDSSLEKLKGVHPDLVELMKEITQVFDCTILGGTRTVEQQEENVKNGLSQTMNSLHIVQKDGYGHAVDVAPTPVNFEDAEPSRLTKYQVQCIAFLFFTKGFATAQGLNVRIGADWNGNNLWTDNNFNDLDHIELPLDYAK